MLASAGVVFQGLLRNPLATPFTLGVSAGAALGAMLAITFGWSFAWLGIPAAPAASFIGSLAAVAIVYALARGRHQGLSTNVLRDPTEKCALRALHPVGSREELDPTYVAEDELHDLQACHR